MPFNESLFHSFGLYYNDNGKESPQFTEKMTDRLSLERAVEGNQDCWQISELEFVQKKKKIIICAFNDSKEEISLWLDLLSHNFELYAFTGQLTPINPIELESQLTDIVYLNKKTLQTHLATQGLSQDETYLVDFNDIYQWISLTMAPAFDLKVSLSNIKNWLQNANENCRFDYYLACTHLTLLADDFQTNDLNPELEKLLANCFGLTITTVLQEEEVVTLLNCCQQLKRLDHSLRQVDHSIKNAYLIPPGDQIQSEIFYEISSFPPTLEEVNASNNLFCHTSLVHLLATCKALKKLNLNNYDDFGVDAFSLPPSLETFSCIGAAISLPFLIKLISSCNKLKTLYCQISSSLPGLIERLPSSLEELDYRCDYSKLQEENLQVLLSDCYNLKKLAVAHNTIGGADWDFRCQAKLTSLEELSLMYLSIPSDVFKNLNISLQKLRKISFHECNCIDNFKELSMDFNALQELDCYRSDISFSGLKKLLNQTDNFTILKIMYCEDFGEFPDHFTLPASLQELNCSFSKISLFELKKLLSHADSLTNLNITECSNFDELPDNFTLPASLQELKCHEPITFAGLSLLLSSAKGSLKRLDFSASEGEIPDNFLLPASLINLNLVASSISLQKLLQITANSTLLKNLNLSRCSQLGDITENCIGLPVSLETLKLEAITLDNLEKLTKRCSQLKKLNIRDLETSNVRSYYFPFKLKSLKVDYPSISFQALSYLLPENSLIKTLDLNFCVESGPVPPDFVLPSTLTQLSLSNITLSFEDLQRLLKNLPNLKILALGYIELTGQLSSDFTLPASLKTLIFRYSSLSLPYFQQLISPCTKLICLQLPVLKEFNPLSLPCILPASLKKLVCHDLLAPGILQTLLSNAHGLRDLSLANCFDKRDEISPDFTLPKNLQNLSFQSLSISAVHLQHLISLCEKLTNFTITLDYDFNLEKPLYFPQSLKCLHCESSNESHFSKLKQDSSNCPQLINQTFSLEMGYYHKKMKTVNSNREFLDKKTESSPNTTLTAQQFFHLKERDVPYPNNYRLKVYSTFSIQNGEAFVTREEILPITECLEQTTSLADFYETRYKKHPEYFLGEMVLAPFQKTWRVLPSLSPNETLIQIETIPPLDLKLRRSTLEGLYYIQAKEAFKTDVTIQFLLQVKPAMSLPTPFIPRENVWHQMLKQIQFDAAGVIKNAELHWLMRLTENMRYSLLIGFCKNFTPKKLPDQDFNSLSLLNTIIREQAGVCRHRTLAFMALAQAAALPARAVYNDIHAFVEICHNNSWIMIDLGGGAAIVENIPIPSKKDRILLPSPVAIKTVLIQVEGKKPIPQPKNRFQTCMTVGPEANTWQAVTEALLCSGEKKILCLIDAKQTESFYYHLAKTSQTPIFYLDDFDKISTIEVFNDDSTRHYQKKDSPLITFLKETKKGGILLVNWSLYRSQHVGFNTLLDSHRRLKGVSIPPEMLVLGLLDKNLRHSRGEDFYSRFRQVYLIPASLEENWPTPPSCEENFAGASFIPFYTEDWKSTLFGRMRITEAGYFYEKSRVIEALERGAKTLVLRLAPWHLAEFRKTILEITLSNRLHANGQDFYLPQGFQFLQNNTPFSFEPYFSLLTSVMPGKEVILNDATYSRFFMQYTCISHHLVQSKGLLAANSGLGLKVVVTSTFKSGQWLQLLEEAKRCQCPLHLRLIESVSLPTAMKERQQHSIFKPFSFMIETNAIELFLQTLQKKKVLPTIVLPIHGKTTAADLIERIQLNNIQEGDDLSFHYQPSALLQAFAQKGLIILKGNPSKQLTQELESLFLENPYLLVKGEQVFLPTPIEDHILFVSDKLPEQTVFNALPYFFDETVIWEALAETFDAALVKTLRKACQLFCERTKEPLFSYSQCESMLKRLTVNSSRNPLKSVLRLHPNYLDLKPIAEEIWRRFMAKAEKTFIDKEYNPFRHRLMKVKAELAESPYLFIAGSSGIGKSFFVQRVLKEAGYEILEELTSLQSFLVAGEKPKLLFIDEANLYAESAFDLFEGLFNTPPSLLVDGALVCVPKNHKVFFSGNFGHFKGRERAAFFEKHGNIITFKELPDAFLLEKTLIPSLHKRIPGQNYSLLECLAQHILLVYHAVNQLFHKTHPLTLRNLQSIVLCLKPEDSQTVKSLMRALALAIYDEINSLYTKENRKDIKEQILTLFGLSLEEFKAYQQRLKQAVHIEQPQFTLTKNRQTPLRRLEQAFQLRQEKILDESLRPFGLNGILFEGEAGIGKSLLAERFLQAKGLQLGKGYYLLTPTDLETIRAQLIKAFHEGAIVIIDEMNTLPLESILNPLLSGMDLAGKTAEKPGFFVIATQNPISYANRQALSPALLNRFHHIILKNYGKKDLITITSSISGNQEKAEALVEEYLETSEYAKKEQWFLEPNPRLLFAVAAGEAKKRKADEGDLQEGGSKRCKIF